MRLIKPSCHHSTCSPSGLRTDFAASPAARRGAASFWVITAIVVTVSLAAVGYFFFFPSDSGMSIDPIMQPVVFEKFEANVLEQGEVRSSDNREYDCEIRSRYGRSTVKWVIKEGTYVREGDVLVELDSSFLDEAFEEQQINVNNALKRVQTAQSNLDAARIAKQEYLQGKYEELKREIENEIFLAEEEYRQYEEIARFSERLAAKSYITELELDAAKFAVERARNRLELSRIKLRVLETQTRRKEEIKFDSDIKAFEAELENERKILATQQKQLAEITEQREQCTIRVREGEEGEVVYANVFSHRGSSEWVLEEGAEVREGQTLIRIPNSGEMEVYAKVNESQIKAVEAGQLVDVKVDAMQSGEPLVGEVVTVNNYPEPESWSSGGIKRFGVTIRIDSPPDELRSGMNASVSIQTRYEAEALQVPVQALVERNGHYFCFVQEGDQFVAREIEVGATNAKRAWVVEGLKSGEKVVMGPRQYEVLEVPEVPEDGQGSDGMLAEDPAKADGAPRAASGQPTGQDSRDSSSATPVRVGSASGEAS